MMIRRCLLALNSLILSTGLFGCAALWHPDAPPLLRLSPASLGRELTLAQRLDVQVGEQTRSVDVALEIDADEIRMAIMQFGQTVAHVVWDGQHLEQVLAPAGLESSVASRCSTTFNWCGGRWRKCAQRCRRGGR